MGKKSQVQKGRVAKGGVAMMDDAKIQTSRKGRSPGPKYAVDVLNSPKGRKLK